jgi:hypothetical protein
LEKKRTALKIKENRTIEIRNARLVLTGEI